MKKVGIIDYGMGNLDSVKRAFEECGGHVIITHQFEELSNSDYIILPGVGSFNKGMQKIKEYGIDETLNELVKIRHVPLLGICLGMQLLSTKGYEGGETLGLGFIEGEVTKFDSSKGHRVPHVGWNSVTKVKSNVLFDSIDDGTDFYFVHSYHFSCEKKEDIITETEYIQVFNSAIGHENIFGIQFHPEKSQKSGFKLIKNFLKL